jgi:hypothetical protein
MDLLLPLEGKHSNALTDGEQSSAITWLKLNKTLAVVTLHRVGFALAGDGALIYIEAGVKIAALTVTLEGLYFSVPLSLRLSQIAVGLDGLEVSLETAFLSIGGGFVRMPSQTGDVYGGKLVVRVGSFSLAAYGFYASEQDHTSVFVDLFVGYPIGGPAAFFITGLAAAMGFHYRLLLPTLEGVADFPLVKMALGKADAPGPTLIEVMETFGKTIESDKNANFGSFGIAFTSFGLVDTFLLASASIGDEMEFSILGLSTLALPPKVPSPILFCKIALRCAYNTGSGVFSLEAALSNESYLLDKNCHLTGGLAVVFWTKGQHSGDFVVSIGGYHPDYQKPAHYPDVDRLGISWKIASGLSLSGSAYFALTPSCVMAGGRFSFVFQEGPLSAWVKLSADMFLSWKPLHYDFRATASIGVGLRVDFLFIHKTFSIELSAGLHIFGPEFSGEVNVDVFFVSFTIAFGNGSTAKPPKLDWAQFSDSFLPQPQAKSASGALGDSGSDNQAIKIATADGLVREVEGGVILDPVRLAIGVTLSIPVTGITADGSVVPLPNAFSSFAIKPMEETDVTATLEVTITNRNANAAIRETGQAGQFVYVAQTNGLPSALWGGAGEVLPNAPTGLLITSAGVTHGHVSPSPDGYYQIEAASDVTREVPRERLDASAILLDASVTTASDRKVSLRLVAGLSIPLEAGAYSVSAVQSIALATGTQTVRSEEFFFHIASDRFHLATDSVLSVYPPKEAEGDFSNTLPNIALSDAAFPWRSRIGEDVDGSSVALILLPENCGVAPGRATLDTVVKDAGVECPLITLDPAIGELPEDECRVLDVPADLLATMLPRVSDLPFTAHIRQTPGADKLTCAEEGSSLTVLGGAFPPANAADGVRYRACLISLRGHGKLLKEFEAHDGNSGSYAGKVVRFVLLHDWSFLSRPEKYDFITLFQGLKLGLLKAGASVLGDGAKLDAGFVPLTRHGMDGKDAAAWYRGPLVPERDAATSPGFAGDASYDAAYQLGRLLALRDMSLAEKLLARRQERVSRSIRRFERADFFGEKNPYQHLADAVEVALTPAPKGVARVRSQKNAAAPVAERFLSSFDAEGLNATQNDEPSDLDKEILDWLGQMRLLKNIPLNYLLPEPSLLPQESLRLFVVDEAWLDSVSDGVLSIGRGGGVDAMHDAGLAAMAGSTAKTHSGFLMRSALCNLAASLEIEGYDENNTRLTVARLDTLADGVMLCMFEGELARLELIPPAEQLHFTVRGDDGSLTRAKRDPVTGLHVADTFTVQLRQNGAVDLAGTAAKLGSNAASDALALQMLGAVGVGVVKQKEQK